MTVGALDFYKLGKSASAGSTGFQSFANHGQPSSFTASMEQDDHEEGVKTITKRTNVIVSPVILY
jgi:hypothetical protein